MHDPLSQSSSPSLAPLPNDVWPSFGLIAGLTDSVEERCAANMRRKRGFSHAVRMEKKMKLCTSLLNCCRFVCVCALCVFVLLHMHYKTASAGHEWASVRAVLWREVKRAPLFSCERLTCRICVKLTSAVVSPLLSVSRNLEKEKEKKTVFAANVWCPHWNLTCFTTTSNEYLWRRLMLLVIQCVLEYMTEEQFQQCRG